MAANKILSYELSPSPSTIFGCLLPAPWMGVAAGCLFAFSSPDWALDRFSPLVLALTHVLALGMLAPIMIGALFQLMPVVAGQAVPGAKVISAFVAVACAATACCLAWGFMRAQAVAFLWALAFALPLFSAVVIALLRAAWGIGRLRPQDATLMGLRWIALGLAGVVALGSLLAWILSGKAGWEVDVLWVLDRHVVWGGVAWLATLVLAVASTVVPMFWQTPKPQRLWHRCFPLLLWYFVLAASVCPSSLESVAWTGLALTLALAACLGLWTVLRAKRHFDPAWPLWVACTASWFLSAASFLCLHLIGSKLPLFWQMVLPWWIGVFALVGGAVLPVNAMLGKIIPFLVFLHLRRQIPIDHAHPLPIPTMQEIILPSHLLWQTRSVLLAFLLLLALPFFSPALRVIAGLLFAASQALMAFLLLSALFRYRHVLRRAMGLS